MSTDLNEIKFSFKAFRNLKKGLGEFDAIVECNEVAIRDFIQQFKASQDKKKFIQDLSHKHEVRVDTVNVELFSSRIRLFYILSVMQQAEQFIDEFRKEYRAYQETWTEKVDGETDFDNLLKNVFQSKGKGIIEIGDEVYYGFEYYRFVRNRFAHSEEKDVKKLDSLCLKISAYSDFYSATFHSVVSPNNYNKIEFADFLLITNIVKYIGYMLCEKCKPNNVQLANRISNLEFKVNSKTIKPIENIYRLKNNPDRFSNAIENLLNSTFGRINKIDRDEIIQHINRILA